MLVDVCSVDDLSFFLKLTAGKADVFEQFLNEGVQASSPNVFGGPIDLLGHFRQTVYSVVRKAEVYTFGV
jgi:hypothetical protein